MNRTSLFGFLATRFSSRPEDLATEALNYILQDPSAREAFVEYLKKPDLSFETDLRFQSQASDSDQARPDLVGIDSEGRQPIIVEAKFWAGLTDNQPITYIKRLPKEIDSLLVFIAPATRFATLWSELKKRCADKNLQLSQEREIEADFHCASLDYKRSMALISWRKILSYIIQALNSKHEVASDAKQLQGLCEQMDTDAFHPLQSEEITSDKGRRISQFCEIVDDSTTRLVEEGVADVSDSRSSSTKGLYGRYMRLRKFGCRLCFHADKWSHFRETPIWLEIQSPDWKFPAGIQDNLVSLQLENPSKLIRGKNMLSVPIYLPLNQEKSDVIKSVVNQVKEVVILLPEVDANSRDDEVQKQENHEIERG